eukprot:2029403-Lingulodinium_polyedra.AAC.1
MLCECCLVLAECCSNAVRCCAVALRLPSGGGCVANLWLLRGCCMAVESLFGGCLAVARYAV